MAVPVADFGQLGWQKLPKSKITLVGQFLALAETDQYWETGKWDSPPDGTVPLVCTQRSVCNNFEANSPSGS